MTQAHYIVGDTRQVTATLPDGCVDLVLTSPPFLALRSYLPADHPDKANEIGSEATPAAFLDVLLDLTARWGRVLAPHGSIAVELGDTYSGSSQGSGDRSAEARGEATKQRGGMADPNEPKRDGDGWPLAKSLTMIPELYRIGLAYGINPLTGAESPAGRWRVRNVVRWHRPNPPVGALGDKYRPATTDMVIATRARDRWFDLDAVRYRAQEQGFVPSNGPKSKQREAEGIDNPGRLAARIDSNPAGAPPLDTWIIPTHPYKGSHYATFPPALCEIPIKSMVPLEVCRGCGTPRRRITERPTPFREEHPRFAEALKACRKEAGMSQRDVDALFGFNGMCSHWERRITGDQSQPSFPTPEQWATLRHAIPALPAEFTKTVEGFRRFKETAVSDEYAEALNHTREEGFYAKGDGQARASVNGPSMTAQRETIGWTNCQCDTPDYRPGVVLDPFAGTGTTLAVATGHGRNAIGIDIDSRNLDLANDRIGPLILTNGPELPDWLRT